MNEDNGQPAYDRYSAKADAVAKVNHYRDLLQRRWWIPLLGVVAGAGFAVLIAVRSAPSFSSIGRMMVAPKLALPQDTVYTEELNNFLGTQTALMQSDVVSNRASFRVAATITNKAIVPVSIKVTVSPKTSIFMISGSGSDPEETQAFVQATMEEYMHLKSDMRKQASDAIVGDLTEEVLSLQKSLRGSEDELLAFQSTNSLVWLQQQGNSVGIYVANLSQELAAKRSEYSLLQALTVDQNLQRQQEAAAAGGTASAPAVSLAAMATNGVADPGNTNVLATGSTSGNDSLAIAYFKAKQDLALLIADRDDFGQFLRPLHPKMIAMNEEIDRRQRLLDIFRAQSVEQLDNRKATLAAQIQNLENGVREWNEKVLDLSRRMAEYDRLKANKDRTQALYERLLATVQSLDVSKGISNESVAIVENASVASLNTRSRILKPIAAGIGCIILSIGLLLLLEQMDDRVNSFTEFQELFDEQVLAQIPRERPTEKGQETGLVQPNDTRHSFMEAYRNLRSSLLYMSQNAVRPRLLLVASSIPNEGKSMTSANLAITLAGSGSKVLLVDGDLRKGVLHARFGLEAENGFCEVLEEGHNWEDLVLATRYPNLSLLPRGGTTQNSSELFIGDDTKEFLKATLAKYDYVVMDTAPVMAADDVTSLAPQMDAVLFVLRAEHTSARIARAALDLLYQRQAKILGVVFNAVRPRSTGYYYYYKYKDYYYGSHKGGSGGNGESKTKGSRRRSSKPATTAAAQGEPSALS